LPKVSCQLPEDKSHDRPSRQLTTGDCQLARIEPLEGRRYFNSLSFSLPVAYPAGTNPSAVVTADLSNDGKIDAVVTDFGSASVAVLHGNGNGTFAPAVFYPVGTNPEGLAVGDLTGSGIPDIVTANEGSNNISVLMGNGDGTFQPQVIYNVGIRPESVALADLNGDGKLDIVVANEGSDTVSVLLNAGNGTFDPPVNYPAGQGPSAVAVGSFNEDGFPDLVVLNPPTNELRILHNDGLGHFALQGIYPTGPDPRSLAVADVNSDTRPDIITADLDSAAISIVGGNGNGTLRLTLNHLSGLRPEGIALADMNGDGKADILTADVYDNGVAVVLRTGLSSVVQPKSFHAGNGPVAVAAADLNGDGRNDIIAADFNGNAISVLLNQTPVTPLIPTTSVIAPSQNPVEAGNRLVLNVQVAKDGISRNVPSGAVQYFDNGNLLAVKPLPISGSATLAISNLSAGTHVITAHFVGDEIFAQSDAAAVTETVLPAAASTPFVTVSIPVVHLPGTYVPGTHGVAEVAIYAQGAGPAVGKVSVQLYASKNTTFDASAFALPMQSSSVISLSLRGNQTRAVPIAFTIPDTIDPGIYTFFAVMTPVSGLASSQVSTVPAVALTTQQAVLQFGRVSMQFGYRLSRTLGNGDSYTLQLTGPGTGNVTENADGGISISLTGTASNTVLHILSTTGVTLDGLIENSIIAGVDAPTANLDGPVHLEYGVHKVTLNDAFNCQLVLGGGLPNVLSFHDLSDVNLFSGAPIDSLSINSYTNQPGDVITTAWIHSLSCAGNFGPSLIINGGVGGRNIGLNSATIGGTLGDDVWRILANVGSVQVGGVAAGWSGSVRGSIGSFIDTGDFAGQIAAHAIRLLEIDGDLTNAAILAGADFGSDARFGGGDDFYGSGTLSVLKVEGSVVDSTVAAGLKPAGGVILGPGATLLPRSGIGSITVGGTVDAASRFLGKALPKVASIDGSSVMTSSDANFVS
jgi:hypothetical protein